MSFDYSLLEPYLDSQVPERHPELQRMEAYAAEHKFPIVGPASGQFCYLIARMIGARSVFELGSGYGYSTAWFARAVRENGGGEVHHVVWDQELSRMAKEHLENLDFGLESAVKIHYHAREAIETLKETPGTFDLIFNDIDKTGYPDTVELVEERLRPGGVFITDNVLWSGRVLEGHGDDSEETQAIQRFTKMITESDKWDATIIPIRDGLMVARKR